MRRQFFIGPMIRLFFHPFIDRLNQSPVLLLCGRSYELPLTARCWLGALASSATFLEKIPWQFFTNISIVIQIDGRTRWRISAFPFPLTAQPLTRGFEIQGVGLRPFLSDLSNRIEGRTWRHPKSRVSQEPLLSSDRGMPRNLNTAQQNTENVNRDGYALEDCFDFIRH